MPEFIYITRAIRPGMISEGPTADEASTLARHFAYVEDLVQQGTALLVGQTQTDSTRTFGLLIFRADDEEAAERLAAADPAVVEGVMTVELFALEIALLSDTWER